MKKLLLTLLVLATLLPANAQWKPAGDKIKTQWAEKVNPEAPLPEYPRPIMVRQDWQNLNGLWSYAISKRGVSSGMSARSRCLPHGKAATCCSTLVL